MTRQSGFTLIELMLVVAITGVLITLGVPAYQEFVRNQSRTTAVNEFLSTLLFSRSEAVARNGRVAVCRSAAPTAATPVCTTGGAVDWATGWLVWMDDDGDWERDAAEEIVRVGQPLSGKNLYGLTDAFAYRANGRIITSDAAPESVTWFTLCDDRSPPEPHARIISIPLSGRPSIGTTVVVGDPDVDGGGPDCSP